MVVLALLCVLSLRSGAASEVRLPDPGRAGDCGALVCQDMAVGFDATRLEPPWAGPAVSAPSAERITLEEPALQHPPGNAEPERAPVTPTDSPASTEALAGVDTPPQTVPVLVPPAAGPRAGAVFPSTSSTAPPQPATQAPSGTRPPTPTLGDDEKELFELANAERAIAALAPLRWNESLAEVARGWSVSMATYGILEHNPNYAVEVEERVRPDWRALGENVGFGSAASQVHVAFMTSTKGHRENILGGQFAEVGIGCVRASDGRLWVTVNFLT